MLVQLFKAVQDISLEGVVVYRALLDRGGQVHDFEYRYANPAACAIMMSPSSDEIVGAKLLERLPLAREHAQLFPRYVRVFTTGETSEAEYELGGRWFHSTAAKLGDGIVVTVQDVSVRRRGEDAQKLLLQELSHRVKNLLASVIAMANSTERGVTSTAEFRDKLSARLQALSRTHGLLMCGRLDGRRGRGRCAKHPRTPFGDGCAAISHRRPEDQGLVRRRARPQHGPARACNQCDQVRGALRPARPH